MSELDDALKFLMSRKGDTTFVQKGVQAIDKMISDARAEAYRAGRIAGLSEAAEIHDAESARLETQIAENTAYCERTGQDPNCSANWFCRNRQDYHRRSAEAIRANAAKLKDEDTK